MDLINEGSNHSNLSTKSEEVGNLFKIEYKLIKKLLYKVEGITLSGCQTTREISHKEITTNKDLSQYIQPLTSRCHSSNEINIDKIFLLKKNLGVEHQNNIDEIIRIYDEKIKIIEGRFLKNKEKNGENLKIF